MKINHLILTILVLIVMTGCTSTRVVSFTDPDAYGKSYSKVVVVADVGDLSDKLTIETKLVETLQEKGINAVSSLSLLPPTREFTVMQENEVFAKNRIDGLVVVQIADAGYFITTEPINVHTETSSGENGNVTSTSASGGGTEHKAFGQFRVSLIDLKSQKTMWVGDADARAFFNTFNPDWDMEYLMKASSKKIAKELINTGLVETNN